MVPKTLPEYVFTVTYSCDQYTELVQKEVKAAYFMHEDGFHILKDGSHTPVYTIRNEVLVSVLRGVLA